MVGKVQKKVMVFAAYNHDKHPLWLALRNNPHPQHGGDRWFVVTGSVEKGESLEQAAVRELHEETGLHCLRLTKLEGIHHSYKSDYHPGVIFDEQAYLAVVDSKTVELNIEHIDYHWQSLNKFVANIWWEGDRSKLGEDLRSAYEAI